MNLELREKVARLVMGLKDIRHATNGLFYGDSMRVVPAYETNWGDAGQVIERMRELGFCFEMEYGPGPNSVCYARFIRTVPRGFGEVRCLPVATAICLAAVAAIESEARDAKA